MDNKYVEISMLVEVAAEVLEEDLEFDPKRDNLADMIKKAVKATIEEALVNWGCTVVNMKAVNKKRPKN